MQLPITTFYAGILGLIAFVLGMLVVKERLTSKASLDTDKTPALLESVRRHGNFAEWVPLLLILLALCEINGLRAFYLHLAGGSLVLGRIVHPLGIRKNAIPQWLRFTGAFITFSLTFILSVALIWLSWSKIF